MDYSKGSEALSKKGFYFVIYPFRHDASSSLLSPLKSISPPTVRQNWMGILGPVLGGEQLGTKICASLGRLRRFSRFFESSGPDGLRSLVGWGNE